MTFVFEDRPPKDKLGAFIARRLKRATAPNAFTYGLVTAAEEATFHDAKVRQELAEALLWHARQVRPLVAPDIPWGDRYAPTLWSCLRRAASMLPEDGMAPLVEFLTVESPFISTQSVLQCLFYSFQGRVPPAGPDLDLLREKVDPLVALFLSEGYLSDWSGAKTCLAMCAYNAGLALGVPNIDAYTQRVLEARHAWDDGSSSSMVRTVLSRVVGIMELCRPDLQPTIEKLFAGARADAKMPFDHLLVDARKDALEWAKRFRPELVRDSQIANQ